MQLSKGPDPAPEPAPASDPEQPPGPPSDRLRLVDGGLTWPPVEELLADWTTTMQAAGLARRTWKAWPGIVARAARATGQHPAAFTASALTRWLADFENPSTRATYWQGLAAWHGWLRDTGARTGDPMARLPRPKVPRGTPRPVSNAGLARLLGSRLHRRTRAMILLAAYQGFRVHEVAKIRGEDLDLDERTLRVLGKGSVDALLPLHPVVAEVAARMPRRGWWFTSPADRRVPVRSTSVSGTIAAAMKRADVAGVPHDLRHWYATALHAAGVDAVTIQQLMRHASLATTQIYTGTDFAELRAAGLRLPGPGALWAPGRPVVPPPLPPALPPVVPAPRPAQPAGLVDLGAELAALRDAVEALQARFGSAGGV